MTRMNILNRREFVKAGLFGSAAMASCLLPAPAGAAVTKPTGDPDHGLKLGVASYSFHKFNLDQAIDLTRKAGVKYITLKDVHLPYASTADQRREVRRQIEAAGLVLMGGGVIYLDNKEEEIRARFDYARDAGMPTMVCSPDPAALDTVEKLSREYDIRIAIHNHGPGDRRYPSPLDVLKLVQDRDPRMGLCIDVGHTVRLGQDPVDVIERCATRLHDFHLKDVTLAEPKGAATEVGKGIIDIVGVLRTLLRVKYPYHLALEYEKNSDNPLPGMVESFAFIRGVLAALP